MTAPVPHPAPVTQPTSERLFDEMFARIEALERAPRADMPDTFQRAHTWTFGSVGDIS